MNRLMMLATTLLFALMTSPALAQREGAGHSAAHGDAHAAPLIAVPHNTDFVYWLAVSFMWLFIAAIILGPIALWVRGPERPEVVHHAAAGGHGHH